MVSLENSIKVDRIHYLFSTKHGYKDETTIEGGIINRNSTKVQNQFLWNFFKVQNITWVISKSNFRVCLQSIDDKAAGPQKVTDVFIKLHWN